MHRSAILANVSSDPSTREGRLAILVFVSFCWLVVAGAGSAYGALVVFEGDLYCEHPSGDSDYGELTWSVLPPGPLAVIGCGVVTAARRIPPKRAVVAAS
jgi:hypothetical protein